jgi:hypothetical protein
MHSGPVMGHTKAEAFARPAQPIQRAHFHAAPMNRGPLSRPTLPDQDLEARREVLLGVLSFSF